MASIYEGKKVARSEGRKKENEPNHWECLPLITLPVRRAQSSEILLHNSADHCVL